MRLKSLLDKARETEGITVETTQVSEHDCHILDNIWRTDIVDYRNQDGSVGVKPKRGVSIQHTKVDARFVDAYRTDIQPDHALLIRTVKAVATMFNLHEE